MPTVQQLLDDIGTFYAVLELIDRGSTHGGKILLYDLFYSRYGVARFRRLEIYENGANSMWFNKNPTPSEITTFRQNVEDKIEDILANHDNVKYLAIDSLNEDLKRAICIGFVDIGSGIEQKRAYVWENEQEEIQYEIF